MNRFVYLAIAYAMLIGALALMLGWFYLMSLTGLPARIVFWAPFVGLVLAAASHIPFNRYVKLDHQAHMKPLRFRMS